MAETAPFPYCLSQSNQWMKDPDKSKISSILGTQILVLPRSDLDMLNAIFFTGFPVSKLHGFSFKSQGKTCITDTQLAVCSPIILARAQPVFEMMESLGISYNEFSANEL